MWRVGQEAGRQVGMQQQTGASSSHVGTKNKEKEPTSISKRWQDLTSKAQVPQLDQPGVQGVGWLQGRAWDDKGTQALSGTLVWG